MIPANPATEGPVSAPVPPPFTFRGDAALCPVVTRALGRVIDPEMALNIVDLGLVHDVSVEGQAVSVALTLTSAACPVGELIVDDATRALLAALGDGYAVSVSIVWDPPWTPARMSPKACVIMGWL